MNTQTSSQGVLIIGATSAIAQACARIWAARGARLVLVGRDLARLEAQAADLRVRGASQVAVMLLDASEWTRHEMVVGEAVQELGQFDIALIAHGSLPDQAACATDAALAMQEMQINGLSTAALMGVIANRLQAQGHGTLAVISSVAGDRGRQSNYVYGSAKALVSAYAQGLRNRLNAHGVSVLTVKPGFVDTPMTGHLPKGLLWAQPERVAADIDRAIARRADVIYTPWFWRWIMLIIRGVPERVFKRLKL